METSPSPAALPQPAVRSASSRLQSGVWLGIGLVAGLMVARLWPEERLQAVATDRDERFAITTVAVDPLGGAGQNPEAVFVLDFLTGRLTGGILNAQNGVFVNSYVRDVAEDFKLDGAGKPKFAIMSGVANLPNMRGVQSAAGVLYIGELTTGKVIAYRIPYRTSTKQLPTQTVEPFTQFSFRDGGR